MAASKLAIAVWFTTAATVATGAGAAVYSLAASSNSSSAASAKPTPSPTSTSALTGGGGSITTAAAKPTSSATTATNGNGQGNNGNGNGNGGSTGTTPGHPITLTGAVTGQPGPGVTATLNVTIDNSKNQAIVVRSIVATVTSVTSGSLAGKPTCDKAWYSIAPFNGSYPIAAGARGVVGLTVTFDDKATINQDNCKGATYNFSFTATADQA